MGSLKKLLNTNEVIVKKKPRKSQGLKKGKKHFILWLTGFI